jgi:hypothetical protein
MFSATMTYPFEIVKTRLHFDVLDPTNIAARQEPRIGEVILRIWSEGLQRPRLGSPFLGGALGFYRGLDQLIPEAALKVLLRFAAFHKIQQAYAKHILGTPDKPLGFSSNLLCGSFAGAFEAALIVQPFERGKTLRADFHSPYSIYAASFREHGFYGGMRVVYTGFVPCLARQVLNQATGLAVIYSLKNWWLSSSHKRELNTLERLGFGFIGGVAGAVLTMPIDVTKSIAQKQQGLEIMSTIQIVRQVLQTRGIRGLYTGLLPRLGRVGLDRAFGFLAFEWTVEHLSRYH